jgi:phosphoglucosamine mutase
LLNFWKQYVKEVLVFCRFSIKIETICMTNDIAKEALQITTHEEKLEFGTDGIRWNVVEQGHRLPFDNYRFAFALKEVGIKQVFLAKDNRQWNFPTNQEMLDALAAAEIRFTMCEIPITTPMAAYFTKKLFEANLEESIGIQFTASHFVHRHNGIKLINPRGQRITREKESEIARAYANQAGDVNRTKPNQVRAEHVIHQDEWQIARDEYLSKIFNGFPEGVSNFQLDLGNGAISHLIDSEIIQEVFLSNDGRSKNITIHNSDIVGFNVNQNCGSEFARTRSQEIAAQLKLYGQEYHIAFDGDGDRIVIVDKNGKLFEAHHLLFLLAYDWKLDHPQETGKIVITEAFNYGIIDSLKAFGIEVVIAEKGDTNVEQTIEKNKALFGSEPENCPIFGPEAKSADALAVFAKVMEILNKRKLSLSELTAAYKLRPEARGKIHVILSQQQIQALLQKYQDLNPAGRVRIWPSIEPGILKWQIEGGETSVAKEINKLEKDLQAEIIELTKRKQIYTI